MIKKTEYIFLRRQKPNEEQSERSERPERRMINNKNGNDNERDSDINIDKNVNVYQNEYDFRMQMPSFFDESLRGGLPSTGLDRNRRNIGFNFFDQNNSSSTDNTSEEPFNLNSNSKQTKCNRKNGFFTLCFFISFIVLLIILLLFIKINDRSK